MAAAGATAAPALRVLQALWSDGNKPRCRVHLPDTILMQLVGALALHCSGAQGTPFPGQRRMQTALPECSAGWP